MTRISQKDVNHYLDLCNYFIKDDSKKLYLQGLYNYWDIKTNSFEDVLSGQTLRGCYNFAVSLYRVLQNMEG